MEKYSFEEIEKGLGNRDEYDTYIRVIRKIRELMIVDSIKQYYPKNLFKENEPFEYLLFTDSKIVTCSFECDANEDILYKFRTIPKSQIQDIELLSDDYKIATLKIAFMNGDPIVLDNIKDTNIYHANKYMKLIYEIHKGLIW